MRFVTFEIAKSGGLKFHVNPEQVVCVMDAGEGRTQIITTGLSGHDSISLVVQGDTTSVARLLSGAELVTPA